MAAPAVHVVATADLPAAWRASARALMDAAFVGDFTDDDWSHALGGWHVLVVEDDAVVAHAAVVPRRLWLGDREVRAGYVEAVAVAPDRQRSGLGTLVMRAVGEILRAGFDVGALSSGEWAFYERVGWTRWRGPSFVRHPDGRHVRSADDDDGLMTLHGWTADPVDPTVAITCEARAGDAW
jgi:aminoglycoside 2'-N-acetyltransferase I